MSKQNHKYYLLNKPYLMLSQFATTDVKPTLSGIDLPDKTVYPVGRLDHDSEGMLILTNDNYLKHQLTSHNNHHKRKYLVQVDGLINLDAIEMLENGLEINVDGKIYNTKPCKAAIIDEPLNLWERNPPVRFRQNIPTSWIEITISEGKNRQVRRMTAKSGFPTLRLIRLSIENLELGQLLPGQFVQISKKKIYEKLGINQYS
jgi:23S rRNA pseudouridine2457 synthase